MWFLFVIIAGHPLSALSLFQKVFIHIVGWLSATIGIFLLFLVIDEVGNPIINHLIQNKYNKVLYQMSILDSSWPHVKKIRQLQTQYLNEIREKKVIK